MKAERKKEIRSLIHTIPMLVKAHLVNQAFETEKVIASTFELSEPFLEILGGKIPQGHIATIQEVYSDLLYKAFNIGIKSGEIKSKSIDVNTNLLGIELDHELDIKMPMYFGVKRDLEIMFREQTGEFLNTVPELKENALLQFERDLETSYRDGLKEYLSLSSNDLPSGEEEEKVVSPIEEEIEDEIEEGIEDEQEFEIELEDEDENVELDEELEDEMEIEEDEEENDENEEDEEIEEDEEDEEVKLEFDPSVEEKKEAFSSLDATAVTAFKVWNKYASEDLKELFKVQAELNMHKENAEMVYAFNNWLVDCKDADLFNPERYLTSPKKDDKSVIQRLEKYAKLLKNSTAEKVLRYYLGLPVRKVQGAKEDKEDKEEKEDKKEKEKEDKKDKKEEPKKEIKRVKIEKEENGSTSHLSKLEAYTKLLKDPEAERVLRYVLGLPPKKASAAFESNLIGPYDPKALKQKIISALKNPTLVVEADVDGSQTIVVDCVASGLKNLPEEGILNYVASKLDITGSSPQDIESKINALAQKLEDAMQLGGDCVFVDVGGDYCLTYTSRPNRIRKISAVKEGLPFSSQGVIGEQDRKQIESLSQLSKSRTIKDIAKASSKVSAYMKKVINDIRWGKLGVAEGGSRLKANLETVVAEVFGLDGLGYYQYLKDKR